MGVKTVTREAVKAATAARNSFPRLKASIAERGRGSKVDVPSGVAVVAAILCRLGFEEE